MLQKRLASLLGILILLNLIAARQTTAHLIPISAAPSTTLTFAVIGDYGKDDSNELEVANMVKSWNPDLIITTGDDYYDSAGGSGSAKYDESTGAYFCQYLRGITTSGSRCPVGQASVNRFFPSLGNHDYSDAGTVGNLPATYTNYFTLPGAGYVNTSNNERYYDFVVGPVHFFAINSHNASGAEPDGTSSTSVQGQWLKTQLASSTSKWNIVYFHYPPYSSSNHGSSDWMQWPFAQWGADAVLNGHDHVYERIQRDGIVYMVNGAGGAGLYGFDTPVTGSAFRYNDNHGAQKVIATESSITFEFHSVDNGGTLRDTYKILYENPAEFTLRITSVQGTVTKRPNQATYHEGDVVRLTAKPMAGWAFTHWSGDLISKSNPSSVTIHGNTSVTANYKRIATLILTSIPSIDGWVLEKGESLEVGGSLNATSPTIRLGDSNLKKQYRSILSFNTSGLPDNAVITSVTLKIRQQSITGGATFSMFQGLLVDVKRGSFGKPALQIADFQATANKNDIGPFTVPAVSGWYTFDLPTAKAFINKLSTNAGLTQFRLRFKLDDNNNAISNYISFFSGNNTVNKPMLIIKFYVP